MVPTDRVVVLALLGVNLLCAVERRFDAQYEDAWTATVQALAEEQLRVRNSDPVAGVIYLDFAQEGDDLSNVSHVVGQYTTKKVTSFSTWKVFRIQDSSAVMVRRVQPRGSVVNVQLNYICYNGFSGLWRALPSNGTLEAAILNTIEKKLKQIVPLVASGYAPLPANPEATEPKNAVKSKERPLIRKFLVVGAAIDNSLSADRLAQLLVEAQVGLDEYEMTGGRQDIALPLQDALAFYKKGQVENGKRAVKKAAQASSETLRRNIHIRRAHRVGPIVR